MQVKKSATVKSRRQSLEIFFVNEKVCFGKQKFQYSVRSELRLGIQIAIHRFSFRNNQIFARNFVVFAHQQP